MRLSNARHAIQSPQRIDQAMEAIDSLYTQLQRLARGQQATCLMLAPSFELKLASGCAFAQRQGLRDRSSRGKSHFQNHRSGGQGQQRDR